MKYYLLGLGYSSQDLQCLLIRVQPVPRLQVHLLTQPGLFPVGNSIEFNWKRGIQKTKVETLAFLTDVACLIVHQFVMLISTWLRDQ